MVQGVCEGGKMCESVRISTSHSGKISCVSCRDLIVEKMQCSKLVDEICIRSLSSVTLVMEFCDLRHSDCTK